MQQRIVQNVGQNLSKYLDYSLILDVEEDLGHLGFIELVDSLENT
jgi:hypothetical protein